MWSVFRSRVHIERDLNSLKLPLSLALHIEACRRIDLPKKDIGSLVHLSDDWRYLSSKFSVTVFSLPIPSPQNKQCLVALRRLSLPLLLLSPTQLLPRLSLNSVAVPTVLVFANADLAASAHLATPPNFRWNWLWIIVRGYKFRLEYGWGVI